MLKERYELSAFGFSFSSLQDAQLNEVEFSIQSRFQGIHPRGLDYIIQPTNYPMEGWQVNGTTSYGAKACASVCRGFQFRPTTLRISAWFHKSVLDYALVIDSLKDWFIKNKPTTKHQSMELGNGEKRVVWGVPTARYNLIAETMGEGVYITFRIHEKIEQAWKVLDYFNTDVDYNEACKRLWGSCVNTYLMQDYFGLKQSNDLVLKAEKPVEIKEDWWGYLSAVAQKIKTKARKENSQFLAVESVKFIEKQIAASVLREMKELNDTPMHRVDGNTTR